jgi:hypothetical protein
MNQPQFKFIPQSQKQSLSYVSVENVLAGGVMRKMVVTVLSELFS